MLKAPIFGPDVQRVECPPKTSQVLQAFCLVGVAIACVSPLRPPRVENPLNMHRRIGKCLEVVVKSVVPAKRNATTQLQIVASILNQRTQVVVHLIRSCNANRFEPERSTPS